MMQVTEAIFEDGVLKPVDPLGLRERERVRLIVQPLHAISLADRARAMEAFRAGAERMEFRSTNGTPTRDDLHDRA